MLELKSCAQLFFFFNLDTAGWQLPWVLRTSSNGMGTFRWLLIWLWLILPIIQYFLRLWLHCFFFLPTSQSNLDLQRVGDLLPVRPFQQVPNGQGGLAGESQWGEAKGFPREAVEHLSRGAAAQRLDTPLFAIVAVTHCRVCGPTGLASWGKSVWSR